MKCAVLAGILAITGTAFASPANLTFKVKSIIGPLANKKLVMTVAPDAITFYQRVHSTPEFTVDPKTVVRLSSATYLRQRGAGFEALSLQHGAALLMAPSVHDVVVVWGSRSSPNWNRTSNPQRRLSQHESGS
jgi:hypothetical protein